MFWYFYLAIVLLSMVPLGIAIWKKSRRGAKWGILIIVGMLIAIITFDVSLGIAAEWLWYSEVGYLSRYRIELEYRLGIFAAMVIPLWILYGWQAQRLLRAARVPTWPTRVTGLLIALAMASFIGTESWETVAMYLHSVASGKTDPIFGLDISFFLFALPMWKMVYLLAGAVWFVALVQLIAGFVLGRALQENRDRRVKYADFTLHVRQLLFIAGTGLLIYSGGYLLDRWELVIKGSSSVVAGASFIDVNWWIPVYLITAVVDACIAVALIATALFGGSFVRKRLEGLESSYGRLDEEDAEVSYFSVKVFATVLLLAFAAQAAIAPSIAGLIEFWYVKPVQMEVEKGYVEHSITGTRAAFMLDRVKVQQLGISNANFTAQDLQDPTFNGVRVWSYESISAQFNATARYRRFYHLPGIDVVRVMVGDTPLELMISARELDRNAIPISGWQSRLIYTHGYGIAAAFVNTPEGSDPLYAVTGMPPVANVPALHVDQPGIYYGESDIGYALVGTGLAQEIEHPGPEDANVTTSYQGTGGIALNSLWRRIVFAHELRDFRIITSHFGPDAKVLWRREIRARMDKILPPSMIVDRDPYVTTGGKTYGWMADIYTWSKTYPYSAQYLGGVEKDLEGVNYMRNPVKATLDAYHGTTVFYVVDENDPIINTYKSIFPGLFVEGAQMPAKTKAQRRYPEGLFNVMAHMYATYHMINPETLFTKGDKWDRPDTEARYIMARLGNMKAPGFMLTQPAVMQIGNAHRMTGILAGLSDGDDYGTLVAYMFPKTAYSILGPKQVEALINADPQISRDVTLWNQNGSTVVWGELQFIPIGDKVFFTRSVFIMGTQASVPQLARVIVGQMHHNTARLVWAPTLKEALNLLVYGNVHACTVAEPQGGGDAELRSAAQQAADLLAEALRKR